jgi:RIO kinase 1
MEWAEEDPESPFRL